MNKIRWVVLLYCVIVPATASQTCGGPFETKLIAGWYRTPLLALRDAAKRSVRQSIGSDVEFAGGLMRDQTGGFRISLGAGCAGRDAVSFRLPRLPAGELVAFWHTHGAHGYARSLFSDADAAVVRQFGLPFYLIDPRGDLRVLSLDNLAASKVRKIRGSLLVPPRAYRGELVARNLAAAR